jgi:hypothetical protein
MWKRIEESMHIKLIKRLYYQNNIFFRLYIHSMIRLWTDNSRRNQNHWLARFFLFNVIDWLFSFLSSTKIWQLFSTFNHSAMKLNILLCVHELYSIIKGSSIKDVHKWWEEGLANADTCVIFACKRQNFADAGEGAGQNWAKFCGCPLWMGPKIYDFLIPQFIYCFPFRFWKIKISTCAFSQ